MRRYLILVMKLFLLFIYLIKLDIQLSHLITLISKNLAQGHCKRGKNLLSFTLCNGHLLGII